MPGASSSTRRKISPSVAFFATNPTWSESEFIRYFLGDGPTTNGATSSSGLCTSCFRLEFQYFAHVVTPALGRHLVAQMVGALRYKPEGRGFIDLTFRHRASSI